MPGVGGCLVLVDAWCWWMPDVGECLMLGDA